MILKTPRTKEFLCWDHTYPLIHLRPLDKALSFSPVSPETLNTLLHSSFRPILSLVIFISHIHIILLALETGKHLFVLSSSGFFIKTHSLFKKRPSLFNPQKLFPIYLTELIRRGCIDWYRWSCSPGPLAHGARALPLQHQPIIKGN